MVNSAIMGVSDQDIPFISNAYICTDVVFLLMTFPSLIISTGGGRTTTAMRAGKIRKLIHCFADRRVKKVKRVVRGRAWNVNLNQYGDYYSFAIYKNGYHRS